MKRLNKIALSVVAIVAVGIGFSGCDTIDRISASRVEATIATARTDIASAQKAIISKVFADNIDIMEPKAPNGESWGEWILEVAGLDSVRWAVSNLGVYPIDVSTKTACYDESKTPLLWLNPRTGNMHFNPSKLAVDSDKSKFCKGLKDSYKNTKANGDKIIDMYKL